MVAFARKGMINHYKTFLQSDMDILDAFSTFGIADDLRNDRPTINEMEKYFCLLYNRGGGGGVNECSLRAVFVQKGKQCQQLPPTLGTLIPHAHVHRTFYMARICKLSQKPRPQFPSPAHYY